jgi:hypothetical protein
MGSYANLLSTIALERLGFRVLGESQAQKRSLNPDDITNFPFSFVTVVVLGQQLVKLMMSINLVLAFLHNLFNDSLVGAEILQPVNGDGPLEVMKLVGAVVVVDDGLDRPIDDRISFTSFVFARFAFLSVCLLCRIYSLVSDRGLRY